MTRFDATEPNHHNRSGQFIWYIKRSTQFVIDRGHFEFLPLHGGESKVQLQGDNLYSCCHNRVRGTTPRADRMVQPASTE